MEIPELKSVYNMVGNNIVNVYCPCESEPNTLAINTTANKPNNKLNACLSRVINEL